MVKKNNQHSLEDSIRGGSMSEDVVRYNWFYQRLQELRKSKPDATVFDGFLYAILTIWRDDEPGRADGEWNAYEALTADDASVLAEEIGIDRTTIWRRNRDYKA